jgi:hypothetical protein
MITTPTSKTGQNPSRKSASESFRIANEVFVKVKAPKPDSKMNSLITKKQMELKQKVATFKENEEKIQRAQELEFTSEDNLTPKVIHRDESAKEVILYED